jgi:hypothetical protein
VSDKTTKDRVKEIMDDKGISVAQLSRGTGIPSARIYKWFKDGLQPKSPDEKLLKSWIDKIEQVPHETKDENQTPTNGDLLGLIESNKILASANKTLADAHKDITRANLELVQMFKELNYRTQSPVLDESDQSTGNTQKRIEELNQKGRSGPLSRPSGGKQ